MSIAVKGPQKFSLLFLLLLPRQLTKTLSPKIQQTLPTFITIVIKPSLTHKISLTLLTFVTRVVKPNITLIIQLTLLTFTTMVLMPAHKIPSLSMAQVPPFSHLPPVNVSTSQKCQWLENGLSVGPQLALHTCITKVVKPNLTSKISFLYLLLTQR